MKKGNRAFIVPSASPLSLSSSKGLLAAHGLKPKKSFGQNFLQDPSAIDLISQKIASLAFISPGSSLPVFEIGAGVGALTLALAQKGLWVHAIERDRDLVPLLKERLLLAQLQEKVVVHEANGVTFDFLAALKLREEKSFIVCGNLPYHLTSSLMLKTLEQKNGLKGAVYLIQTEVAERIASLPGSRVYGLLSVLMQSRFHVSIIHHFAAEAFWPAPAVSSSLLQLLPKSVPLVALESLGHFKTVVKMAFCQRRKTLRNALSAFDFIEEHLRQAQLDPKMRAEELSPADFARLMGYLQLLPLTEEKNARRA